MTDKKYPAPVNKQSNVITSARYNYTLIEKRIIYHILIQLKKHGLSDDELEIVIPLNELTKESKLSHIQRSCVSMLKKIFEIKEGNKWTATGLLQYVSTENGKLTTEISKKIKPYLLDLDKNFTRFNIEVASNLRSVHAQRFYELCCRFRDTGKWNIKLDELKAMLMLEDKYVSYGHFKDRVLEPAKKELQELYNNNESDVCFTYQPHKAGKKVIELWFTIFNKEKNKGSLDLTTDERQKVMDYLKWVYPENNRNKWRDHVYRALDKKKGLIDFIKKVDEISNRKKYKGKSPGSWAAVVTHSLRQDFSLEI